MIVRYHELLGGVLFLQLMPPEVKACGQGAGSLDELLKVRCVFGGKQSIGFGQMNVTPFEVT